MEAASFLLFAHLRRLLSEKASPRLEVNTRWGWGNRCLATRQKQLGGPQAPFSPSSASTPLSQLGTAPAPWAFFGTCAWILLRLAPPLFWAGSRSPQDTRASWWLVGSKSCSAPARNLRQKDPRIPGRRFLAGLGTCRLPSSPAQGDPQVGTTLRGHREVCCNLSRAHSPSATSFLLPAVKLFSFLKFSSQE